MQYCIEESTHLLAKKIQEIPPIEFSYETYYSHRKEQSSSKYNVGLLIPKSKKYIAWFTFLGEKDVCILLELNREKQIVHHKLINVVFDQKKPHLALGTFLYGSLFTTSTKGCQTYFVIEDIFMYKSVSLRKLCFGHRFAILSHILPEIIRNGCGNACYECGIRSAAEDNHAYSEGRRRSPEEYEFVLPMMFDLSVYNQEKNVFPDISNVLPQVCYPIHKIQYRSFTEIIPYMNYDLYLFTSKQPKQEKIDVVSEPPSPPTLRISSLQSAPTGQRAFTPSTKSIDDQEVEDLRSSDRRSSEDFGQMTFGHPRSVVSSLTDVSTTLPTSLQNFPDLRSSYLTKFSSNVSDMRRSFFVERIEKERDVFMVSADIQSDIYHLNHVHGKYRPDVAYIPNYKTSVFMNSLFRTIKENHNLDTMEESDDEEEFQDIRMEKYVNLEKCIPMECMYHRKFKRWIPIKTVT
uniref:Uncharacterized protein n=1 Tax=viral metagenome TaxID=1070528 RepID=A0A6C0HUM6_9ZZZZ